MKHIAYFKLLLTLVIASDITAKELTIRPVPVYKTSQMLSGGIGLIQTPTARMGQEGDMSLNYTDINEYRFWSVNLQFFPWMESTIRYTDVRSRLYSNEFDFSGDQSLKDKGIDVKFRLLEENDFIPETSIGFKDFGGTGFFESEFIGVSKQIDNFDVNIGIGWGYLGTSDNITNPTCKLKDSYCVRPKGFTGQGGNAEFGHFFKGTAALFGGVEYQTPWESIRLKVEYEGNNYTSDVDRSIEQDSKWNFAATYFYDNFNFSFSYNRGNTIGLSISYKLNLHNLRQDKIQNKPRPIRESRHDFPLSDVNSTELVQQLYSEAGFTTRSSSLNKAELTIYGTQIAYRDKEESIQRIGRTLIDTLPNKITSIKIVENVNSLPMIETEIDVKRFIQAANYEKLETDIEHTYLRQAPSEETLSNYKPANQSGFYTNFESYWAQTFGSPEKFYFFQGGMVFNTGYIFNKNLSLDANFEATLFDNYEDFNFTQDRQDSSLPRVRTQIREYVSRNVVSLDSLYTHWKDRVSSNLYAQLYAGYLETMYGGAGAELLYHPVDTNLAYGFDINYVKQRDFENHTDFLDYTALTGHINLYWQPESFKDIHVTLNVGQFLAKDRGFNVDIAKRYNSGVIVGAYAAITNVSAEDYGEGSFTKGFYMTIPFDLFTTRPSKGQGYIPWAPIARDGGQMLNRPSKLHHLTNIRSQFY